MKGIIDTNQGKINWQMTGYRPVIFDPQLHTDIAAMRGLREEIPGLMIFDEIESQLKDVIKLQHPRHSLTAAEYDAHIIAKLGETQLSDYGVWVYYPWRTSLVHLLPKEEFIRVRTIRNAYKITHEEQAILGTKKIGVIGLSVGQSAALAVAIERAAGEIRIADFDTLELSNLNRIRSSVCNLGLPKTYMVAREIAELDPFLPVRVWEDGITEENIESFLTDGGALDLLIEECDSVDVKVLAREHARKHRIAVLMDTSDRGMIDVERYDLDPEYPMLHGLLDPSVDYAFLKTLKTSEEKLPYIAPILGIHTMSIRLRASALEVGQSISTWPQLGGDVMHGGALCVQHAKEILLGQSTKSFRSFASPIEEQEEESTTQPRFSDEQIRVAIVEGQSGIHWDQGLEYAKIDNAFFDKLITAASRASTPGNTQAFKWVLQNNTLFLVTDRSFEKAFSDNFGFGSQIGYGCVLENLTLYAASLGFQVFTHLSDDFQVAQPTIVIAARLTKADHVAPLDAHLAKFIHIRETTRTTDTSKNPTPQEIQNLQDLAATYQATIVTEPVKINALRELTVFSDIIRMTNSQGFHDLFKEEIVWDYEQYLEKREGIYVGDLQLNTKEKVGVEIYNHTDVNSFIRQINGGNGFGDLSVKYLQSDPTFCLFQSADLSPRNLFEVGRKIQRFWLELTAQNLSMHPFTSSIMIASYLHSDKNDYLKAERARFIVKLDEVNKILDHPGQIVFIAKIVHHSGADLSATLRKSTQQNSLIDAT